MAALEAHLTAAQHRRGEQDPGVEAAYAALSDAFESYDEALYDAYDEPTPFILYEDVEDDDEDDDLEEDADDAEDAEEGDTEPDDAEDDLDDDEVAGPSTRL